MIAASPAYLAANAKLQKEPVCLLAIDGYDRAFSNRLLGDVALPIFGPRFVRSQSFSGTAGSPIAVPTGFTLGNSLILGFTVNNDAVNVTAVADTVGNAIPFLYNSVEVPGGPPNQFFASLYCTPQQTLTGIVLTFDVDPGAMNGLIAEYAGIANLVGLDFIVAGGAENDEFSYSDSVGPTEIDGPAPFGPLASPYNYVVGFAMLFGTVGTAIAGTIRDANAGLTLVDNEANSWRVNCTATDLSATSPPWAYGTATMFFEIAAPVDSVATFPWLVDIADLKTTVSPLDGGSNLGSLVVTVQDRQQSITADMASFVLEGKRAWLLSGFAGMNSADFAILFTGVVDTVDSANGNTEYVFTVSDVNLKKLTQVIYTTGDDGFATSSKHPKTLNGHPLDILVSALGQAGVTSIDTAKIHFYRDTIFSGLNYEFLLTSAPACKDFCENEICKPLGMYLWQNNLGLVTINSFYPAISGNGSYTPPTPPVMTLDLDQPIAVPLEQQADLIDQVTFRFDWDDLGSSGSQQFLAESVQNYAPSIAKYGLYGNQIIEAKGMRSGFQGFFMAAIVARLIFLRYGSKQLLLDPVAAIWSACLLEPGDVIAVTNPFVPDRKAGALGVAAMTFEVQDRNLKFMSGQVELTLLQVDISQFKQYLIAPDGQPDYASDTAPNRAQYMYQSDATGKYSTGDAGNTLG